MDRVAIAAVEDGALARVRGTVRRAHGEVLRSLLGEVECVYWDVREGFDAPPAEAEGQSFWLEDESGRVLVRGDEIEVEARASRREQVIAAADSDMHALSQRLRAIKDRLRATGGDEARELARERKRLAKLATLLCAIKAQARGRVHLSGTLESQGRWIERNQHLAEGEASARTVQLMVSRWETVIAEGDVVEVEALFRVEPMPPGVGGGGGYRDRPTCLAARPAEGGRVRVRGVGASAPLRAEEPHVRRPPEESAPASSEPGTPHDPAFERLMLRLLVLVALGAIMAWWLR